MDEDVEDSVSERIVVGSSGLDEVGGPTVPDREQYATSLRVLSIGGELQPPELFGVAVFRGSQLGTAAESAGLHQQAKPCHTATEKRAIRDSLKHGQVTLILAGTFVLFLGFNFFYAGFPVHAAIAYGWDIGELGAFFAVLAGMMIVAQGPLLSFASKHIDRRLVFAVGMAFLTAAVVTYRFEAGAITYVGAAFFAIGNGLAWPTFQSRVAELAGDAQGAVQGAVTSTSSLASIAGLLVGGFVYPTLGGDLFFVTAILFAIVLVLTPLWFPTPADSDGDESP